MTAAERTTIRAAIDEARRQALAAAPLCEFCGEEMERPQRGQTKRFCSKSHRNQAWYRDTERGRAAARLAKRRRRRRQGIPRRATHETA